LIQKHARHPHLGSDVIDVVAGRLAREFGGQAQGVHAPRK